MKIITAKTAGFCMGVKRAVDLALENAGKVAGGLKTVGPLIHNRQTLDMLRQRNVVELDETRNGDVASTLLIRAHGIPPETQRRYAGRGHVIIDGTCPKVKTVHKVIERFRDQGYRIVIAGDSGHAEVIGLLGYAGNAGCLVQTPGDVDALPDSEKACLVSQTTFDRTVFDQIAAQFRRRFGTAEIIVKKTICAATDQRQTETEALSRQVDAMIVVGGKNSANTQRLASISNKHGTPTQLVETEKEIDWTAIAHCKTVGITAGASTPNWMIKRIAEYLRFMDQTQQHTVTNLIRQILDGAANLNVFVALGAVAMYYVSCRLQGYSFHFSGAALAFLYFLSMYLWNSVTSFDSTQHLGISRFRFYNKNKRGLFTIAVVSIVAILALSITFGKSLFYLMLFATVSGSAYHVTIIPGLLRYRKLKDIPTSRDLFVALAWATVLTFIPQAINGRLSLSPVVFACFGWIFVLAFLRSLIFDLRDIEGDRIMGRETLITILGEKKARRAIHVSVWLCVAILSVIPWAVGLEADRGRLLRFLSQIGALPYASIFVKLNPRLKSNNQVVFNILADGLFYLAGLGAWCASLAVTG